MNPVKERLVSSLPCIKQDILKDLSSTTDFETNSENQVLSLKEEDL